MGAFLRLKREQEDSMIFIRTLSCKIYRLTKEKESFSVLFHYSSG